jgi:hypothetical protein
MLRRGAMSGAVVVEIVGVEAIDHRRPGEALGREGSRVEEL